MVYLHEAVFCANVTIYTSHLIDKSLKINIYKNIILNKLNYASRIWIPNVSKTDRKNLKRINKRALKLLNRVLLVLSSVIICGTLINWLCTRVLLILRNRLLT